MPGLLQTWVRFVDGRPVSGITDAFFAVVLKEAFRFGQEGFGVDLGQRKLARKPRGKALAGQAQPPSQKEWAKELGS